MHDAFPEAAPSHCSLPRPDREPASLCNEQIKAMLRHFGLRTSLIRLKVIHTLLQAHLEGAHIGVRGVHGRLQGEQLSLSFVSVREVLKRLTQERLLTRHTDNTFSMTCEVQDYLDAKRLNA
ncbi:MULTISPECIES: fe2+ zn2+ uptake regulation protein [unclassified Pseudomonas]|uniref:fe2+ zn2+ uptake regulation protein n=1 Tax=unclassified Pseudomonas TaxID=196821 RepID=UPI000BC5DC13|nr:MULTISPECIES: fe2+ zn2+ uptake regulation protein [unclassified Pseudomonas]PVZ20277.1 hypothetical protein F474_00873 [Pseudomonas sp. URIL14HWK12:I12]PVZ27343.1 hypothetical protein F470_00528 [Pseudomonas sp. URIL14HWK12:I10]PVZ38232.1 hypothetical protein F472_00873 [Pseudomonas sp. URIL14HWK12:I11]SNZ04165.1 hypothetical protein SAMN05660463_00531 [Pseudomonas sp. URIL14HWK12:I9]